MAKDAHMIGIDVGTSSVKLVELKKSKEGTYSLVTYGFVEHVEHNIRGDAKDTAMLAHVIKRITEKAGCSTTLATAALPTYSVFTSLISLPIMSKDELESAIHWEAKKIIPLPLEEITLDYKILNPEIAKGGSASGKKKEEEVKEADTFKVLITGAAKETVQRYTDIFEQCGLTLTSLETEMFAISRSLVGSDPAEVMIVEIGATITDIIVVENGIPFIGRTIETGGAAMTRAIMNSLHINDKRAEQLKRDIGVSGMEQAGEGGGGVPDILKGTLEPLIHEIRYTMDQYKSLSVRPSKQATGTIEKIILTGGSSLLPGLAEYLSKALDMRVILGDPWAGVTYPADLKPILNTIGTKFSVAIGLAMREN